MKEGINQSQNRNEKRKASANITEMEEVKE